jgi:DNA-binding XRE family transcriptional regulator
MRESGEALVGAFGSRKDSTSSIILDADDTLRARMRRLITETFSFRLPLGSEVMSDRLPNAIDRHVASRLRSRRLETGITQTQLAHAVGVTFQQLQKYESGINRISAGALYQLSIALEVPVQYFFDGLILGRRHERRRSSGVRHSKAKRLPIA